MTSASHDDAAPFVGEPFVDGLDVGAPAARVAPASDGYPLRYWTWAPATPATPGATEARAPRALLLNGVMSHALWLGPLARRLAEAGLAVVGADRRGSGYNDRARGDAPSGEQLLADVQAIVDAERARDGERPLVIVGWCYGAILAVHLAQRLEHTHLALLAPGIFPTDTLKARVAAQRARIEAGPEDAPVVDSPIDEIMFTTGPALDTFVRRDPRRLRQVTPRFQQMTARLTMLAAALLARAPRPTLVLLAEHDDATDEAATRRAIERLPDATRARFTLEPVPGTRHGLLFDAPDAVARRVLEHLGATAR